MSRQRRAARLITLAAALVVAGAPEGVAQIPASIEFRVPKPPTVAAGDSGAFLSYELHVTNFAAQTMTLKRVEVAAAGGNDGRRVLLTVADSVLLRSLTRPGTQTPLAERAKLAGGTRAVIWLWVPVDRQTPPASVQTRVILEQGTGDSARTQELDGDRKSTRLNSSHGYQSRMPSSA